MESLQLGVRIVNLIDTGTRESTYKLATLLALCQYATEHHPRDAGGGLPVPMTDLADRVIAMYWRQREPFPATGTALRQVRRGEPQILQRIDDLREATMLRFNAPVLWRAATLGPAYDRTRRQVAQVLAQMPLTHLQRAEGGKSHDPFLYDDSALRKKMNRDELDAIGWTIVLRPGIARALAELSPLLAPLIEIAWVGEVRRFNHGFDDDSRLEQHLFGLSRTALDAVRAPLVESQRGACFYCRKPMRQVHVDHVLPWSRTGLDDLANLVACDPDCNLNKSDSMPVADLVVRAVERGDLVAMGRQIVWPVDAPRVLGTARSMLTIAPVGLRLWQRRGEVRALTEEGRAAALATLR